MLTSLPANLIGSCDLGGCSTSVKQPEIYCTRLSLSVKPRPPGKSARDYKVSTLEQSQRAGVSLVTSLQRLYAAAVLFAYLCSSPSSMCLKIIQNENVESHC